MVWWSSRYKDSSILGSILGSPYFGKPRYSFSVYVQSVGLKVKNITEESQSQHLALNPDSQALNPASSI